MVDACDAYTTPSGNATYTSSGLYHDTIPNAVGCDSVISIDLTMHNSSLDTVVVNACDSFPLPSGSQTLTTSGTYVDTLSSTAGCDSVLVIELTIDTVVVLFDSLDVCVGDTAWMPDGTVLGNLQNDTLHTSNLPTGGPCGSTVFTSITVHPHYDFSDSASTCIGSSYTFHDGTVIASVTQSMIHDNHLTSAFGCDSLVTTFLTAHPVYQTTESDTACLGDTYTFPDGNTITVLLPMSYTSSLSTNAGCDSLVLTNLVVPAIDLNLVQEGDVLIAQATGVSYQWMLCGTSFIPLLGDTMATFNVPTNGIYALELTAGQCVDTTACISVSNVGLGELDAGLSMQLVPNPASDVVTLLLSDVPPQARLRLLDAQGRVVRAATAIGSRQTLLDVADLPAGMYLAELSSSAGRRVLRLLVD